MTKTIEEFRFLPYNDLIRSISSYKLPKFIIIFVFIIIILIILFSFYFLNYKNDKDN